MHTRCRLVHAQGDSSSRSQNASFSNGVIRSALLLYQKTRTLWRGRYFYQEGFRFIPTVYASNDIDISNETGSGDESETTSVDQLEIARPKVLVTDDDVKMFLENETGVDRVRAMFSKDKNGDISADLASVLQIAQTCGFFFFLVTSIAGGIQARDSFLGKNKSTVYATKFQAARAYNDAVFVGSMRFGLKWGLKSALFAGIFTLTSQTIAVYRNKTSIVDYVAGGGLTGALLRMNLGLRGTFAGGVIGGAIGLLGGTAMCTLLYFTNETQQHRHFLYVHQSIREKREADLLGGSVVSRTIRAPDVE